jgi:hypothetical protein
MALEDVKTFAKERKRERGSQVSKRRGLLLGRVKEKSSPSLEVPNPNVSIASSADNYRMRLTPALRRSTDVRLSRFHSRPRRSLRSRAEEASYPRHVRDVVERWRQASRRGGRFSMLEQRGGKMARAGGNSGKVNRGSIDGPPFPSVCSFAAYPSTLFIVIASLLSRVSIGSKGDVQIA